MCNPNHSSDEAMRFVAGVNVACSVVWQAPNYFSVISKPMDFTTVRENLAAGKYVRWHLLEEDMMTMFQNAMTYNSPSTTFHKQAKTLMQVAKKLIALGKEGVTNFRGKTAGVVRAHNAQVAADDRAEKNAQKAAIRLGFSSRVGCFFFLHGKSSYIVCV